MSLNLVSWTFCEDEAVGASSSAATALVPGACTSASGAAPAWETSTFNIKYYKIRIGINAEHNAITLNYSSRNSVKPCLELVLPDGYTVGVLHCLVAACKAPPIGRNIA